jgi:ribulose-5-phosphate 4-epimerase/fuculose-1-phosphate aldolase
VVFDSGGGILEGEGPIYAAAAATHARVHAMDPAAQAVCLHLHPPAGTASSRRSGVTFTLCVSHPVYFLYINAK